jgi:hypothetical protein
MKVEIKKDKRARSGVHWTACEPFVENTMAVLIHRVRYVTTHKIGERWPAHLAVSCWCGNTMTGTTKFTFLDAPPDERIVCARCEDNAVDSGLPTSRQLAGKHIHTGGVVAVKRCCDGEAAHGIKGEA